MKKSPPFGSSFQMTERFTGTVPSVQTRSSSHSRCFSLHAAGSPWSLQGGGGQGNTGFDYLTSVTGGTNNTAGSSVSFQGGLAATEVWTFTEGHVGRFWPEAEGAASRRDGAIVARHEVPGKASLERTVP
jgi:hypothetical protein